MAPGLPLITTIATALGLALLFGFIAIKLKLPALVGYLVAGIVLGPFTPGFVANSQIAGELAEIGVMLLMFGVGLHFSFDRLLEMKNIALPGALIQIAVATALGTLAALGWDWSIGSALILGLSLSVASTVVLIKALELQALFHTQPGQIAISWLIVEDLVMILVLVILPPLAGYLGGVSPVESNHPLGLSLLITLSKVGCFIVIMLLIGRRILPKLLLQIARTGSRELFTLCVVATAVSIAYAASEIFGMSFALGAFFSGMIMQESKFSHRAAEESLPLRDAFAVLFFVAVGMLFDPYIFVQEPLKVLEVVAIIIIGKSIAAFGLMLLFRYPLNTVLIISASLAQIGEFSFILAELGVKLRLLPQDGQSLIFAGAIISISLNPLLFRLINVIHQWMNNNKKAAALFSKPDPQAREMPKNNLVECLSGEVILVGYGQVGHRIAQKLLEKSIAFVVIEEDISIVQDLKLAGLNTIHGSACDLKVLRQARLKNAGMLVITIADPYFIDELLRITQALNTTIEISIRVERTEEAELLKNHSSAKLFYSEETLAEGMSQHILKRFGLL